MNTSKLWMYLLSLVLAAAATSCGGQENADPTAASAIPVVETVQEAESPMPTQEIEAISSPQPSPSPQSVPAIEVEDQVLTSDGKVNVSSVTSERDGWVVLYNDQDGQLGNVVGYTKVAEGLSDSLVVDIDIISATRQMYALLHLDQGQPGEFEYPGSDLPVEFEQEIVKAQFELDIKARMPELIAADQTMSDDGIIIIDEIYAGKGGYLALFSDSDNQPGRLLGYIPVQTGSVTNVGIEINWREATPTLHAVLYSDDGEPNVFQPDSEDKPVLVAGEAVSSTFKVQYPPDVFVINQPIITGTVEVESAVSYGPGWLVVYTDNEGAMGTIIGQAALADGLNEQIVIEISQSAATPVMYLLLHEDQDDIGQFEFPRSDPPVRFNDRFPEPFAFETDGGNYLIAEDQALGPEGLLTIPLVVVDVDSWVVARQDDDGEAGEIISSVQVPAGINRQVTISVDPEQVTPQIHIFLHLNAGDKDLFEFPDGVDIPLQRNRSEISIPLTIIEEES